MNNGIFDEQLRQQLLARFQRELVRQLGWLGWLGWLGRKLSGEPPAVGYVQEFADFTQQGEPNAEALRLWRITPTTIESLLPEAPIPEPGAANGMFYDIGYFSFSLPDTSGFGTETSQVGPRYGRGFRYRVVRTSHGPEIQSEERLWVS